MEEKSSAKNTTYFKVAINILCAIALVCLIAPMFVAWLLVTASNTLTPDRAAQAVLRGGYENPDITEIWGNWIIEPLRYHSHDFADITPDNAKSVARTLVNLDSDEAIKASKDLYCHDNIYSQLAGSVVLGKYRMLPDEEFAPDSLIGEIFRGHIDNALELHKAERNEKLKMVMGHSVALMVVEHARYASAVPFIIADLLSRYEPYAVHSRNSIALLEDIGDPRAIEAIKKYLSHPDFNLSETEYAKLNISETAPNRIAFYHEMYTKRFKSIQQSRAMAINAIENLEAKADQYQPITSDKDYTRARLCSKTL